MSSHSTPRESLTDMTCAICLETFTKDDLAVRSETCYHPLHLNCAIQLYLQHGATTCPCCRGSVHRNIIQVATGAQELHGEIITVLVEQHDSIIWEIEASAAALIMMMLIIQMIC